MSQNQDHVDRVQAQWRAERPEIDTSPMGIIARLHRIAAGGCFFARGHGCISSSVAGVRTTSVASAALRFSLHFDQNWTAAVALKSRQTCLKIAFVTFWYGAQA